MEVKLSLLLPLLALLPLGGLLLSEARQVDTGILLDEQDGFGLTAGKTKRGFHLFSGVNRRVLSMKRGASTLSYRPKNATS